MQKICKPKHGISVVLYTFDPYCGIISKSSKVFNPDR